MIQDPKTMKSPITGGNVILEWERRMMEFRKEKFPVYFPFYKCMDTGEHFTTTESDGVWYAQLHNQYCKKYGIPYVDEIIAIREKYGLSASKMSVILGFGPNQWRKYEQEEIPNVSNGRMIRSIMNPDVMLDMVESARELLTECEYEKIQSRVASIATDSLWSHIEHYEQSRVFAAERSMINGFGPISLDRLKNVMLYVLDHCQDVWQTKMNKLLFYIDFLSYRERGVAITGLSYRAIDYGPVPERWERVYSSFDEIAMEMHNVGDYDGVMLHSEVNVDNSLFTNEELLVMKRVCDCFGNYSSRDLSNVSHQENGWINNHLQHSIIPYEEAFSLRAI